MFRQTLTKTPWVSQAKTIKGIVYPAIVDEVFSPVRKIVASQISFKKEFLDTSTLELNSPWESFIISTLTKTMVFSVQDHLNNSRFGPLGNLIKPQTPKAKKKPTGVQVNR